MIRIRPAESGDAERIASIYAAYVASGVISFEDRPPGTDEMRARMTASDGFFPWLVATDADPAHVLGYAYATRFRERTAYRFVVETTIYVAGDMHRKGLGRLLYGALLTTLRAQRFTQAIAAIALPNDASIGLHESVGFRRAGVYREVGYKDGRWVDVGLWQAQLATAETPPLEPQPFRDIGLVRDD